MWKKTVQQLVLDGVATGYMVVGDCSYHAVLLARETLATLATCTGNMEPHNHGQPQSA
jgi:hypothetical protein